MTVPVPSASIRTSLFRDGGGAGDLTALYREIWRLAWPVFIGQGLNAAVGFVSRIIVSKLGPTAFNAVNVGMMIFFVIITVIAAVGVGTTALVARHWGAGDRRKAGEVLQQSLIYGELLALLIAILGVPLSRVIFHLITASPESARQGALFMTSLFLAAPVIVPGFFLSSGLRGAGDTRTPMFAGLVMGVLSLVLSYGLILGGFGLPRLEVFGAALAIIISFGVFSALLILVFVLNKAVLKLPRRGWRPINEIGVSIFKIGVPSAMEWILIQVGLLVYVGIVYKYGETAAAGYFIGFGIVGLVQTPAFGVQTAATTIVGQSLGAGDHARAEMAFRRCAMLGFVMMAVMGIGLYEAATPGVIEWLFGSLQGESLHASGFEDPIEYAREYIFLLMLVMPLMGLSFPIAGGLRGAGDTIPPLVASSVGMYGGRVIMAAAVYAVFHPPVQIVFLSMFPDLILRILIMTFRVWTGKWKLKKV